MPVCSLIICVFLMKLQIKPLIIIIIINVQPFICCCIVEFHYAFDFNIIIIILRDHVASWRFNNDPTQKNIFQFGIIQLYNVTNCTLIFINEFYNSQYNLKSAELSVQIPSNKKVINNKIYAVPMVQLRYTTHYIYFALYLIYKIVIVPQSLLILIVYTFNTNLLL